MDSCDLWPTYGLSGGSLARINIEPSLYTDPHGRFMRLVVLENGDRFRAKGMMVTAWELGQIWYTKSPHRTIPIAEWDKAGIPETVIEVGLAKRTEHGVRVSGADEQFQWLLGCIESGRKGGKAKSRNHREKPLGSSRVRLGSSGETYPPPLTLPLSPPLPLSPSSNSNSKKEELRVTTGSAKADTHRRPISASTWLAYQEAYKNRYGVDPVRNATVNAQLANFVKRLGEEEAPLVAAYYVNHNKAFYVEQRHPVGMLLRDAEGLRTQWLSGKKANKFEAQSAETKDHMQSQLERIAKGEI